MTHDKADANFQALDSCHQQTLEHLEQLQELAAQFGDGTLTAQASTQAGEIDRFFVGTSREHHAEEEKTVFPPLLASGDDELVQLVQALQQDHGWIERNWDALGPQLRAIAQGESWPDPAGFQQGVDVFITLCREHIGLEETLVYPQSKTHWASIVAARTP